MSDETKSAEDDGITTDPQTGRVTVPLKYPPTLDGRPIDKITLRRPKGKDLVAMENISGGEMARTLSLIGMLAVNDDLILGEALDGEDIGRLSRVIAGFFGGLLPTGGTFGAT